MPVLAELRAPAPLSLQSYFARSRDTEIRNLSKISQDCGIDGAVGLPNVGGTPGTLYSSTYALRRRTSVALALSDGETYRAQSGLVHHGHWLCTQPLLSKRFEHVVSVN